MNDEQATRLLTRLAEEVPVGPAPVSAVLRDGTAVRRRRHRTATAAAAAVLVVPVGVATLAQSMGDRQTSPVPAAPASTLPVPDGTRLVGVGSVAVAVPTAWGTNAVKCGQPVDDTVYFANQAAARSCAVDSSNVAALRLARLSSPIGQEASATTEATRHINGIPVRLSPVVCTASDPGLCSQTIIVPSEDAGFTIYAPTRQRRLIDDIRQSLQTLPDGLTTVPYDPNAPVDDTMTLMRDAGLAVQVVEEYRPGLSGDVLLASDPALGSVVPRSSTVTLTISSDYPTTPDGRTYGRLPTGDKPLDPNDLPDLIAVVGDNGVEGYAETSLVIGPAEPPASPEEALEQQQNAPESRSVPVYAKDGVTVIDTLTVGGPNSTS